MQPSKSSRQEICLISCRGGFYINELVYTHMIAFPLLSLPSISPSFELRRPFCVGEKNEQHA